MRKKIFVLSILISFLFLFFFTMCVRYTDRNSYNIQNQKKENREKEIIFKEYPEIKSVDLLYEASILFELYEIKKSLNLEKEKYQDVKFYTSVGCERCMNTGYIGRIPVFEIIYFDDVLKNMLAQKKEIKQNFKTLLENAMDKAREGLTSLDEIMRQI